MPKITKDGVTVGKNIMLKDRGEELGAALIRSVGHKLNTLAGDGTTTSIVLATAIIREGLKYSTDPNINL
jgi:chaperonin GroEL